MVTLGKDKFLSSVELAERLGVSRQSVHQWILDGRYGEVSKIGGNYAIPVSMVVDSIKSEMVALRGKIEALKTKIAMLEEA